MSHTAAESRYENVSPDWFRRCGASGLMLPAISLGCWHNFGDAGTIAGGPADEASMHANARQMLFTAFDAGITHFDLANNYGPEPGAAETRVGRILKEDLAHYRDELIISSKAGYRMWPGPYGEWGSRKYLLASLDASLKRLGLDYVDVFYSHRPDPDTPLEETMLALDQAVRLGKALYVGISNYDAEQTTRAIAILRELRTPLVLHQPKYSMYERSPERGLLEVLEREGVGCIVFSPLAQGLLSSRYLRDLPEDSRAAKPHGYLEASAVTAERRAQLNQLDAIARARGQTLAQLAIAWVLRHPAVTSALVGASRVSQLEENLVALERLALADDELRAIEEVLA